MPKRDDFLKYVDPDYFEERSRRRVLRGFILSNLSSDPDKVDYIIDEIYVLAAQEAKTQF